MSDTSGFWSGSVWPDSCASEDGSGDDSWDAFHKKVGTAYKKIFKNHPTETFGMRANMDIDIKASLARKRRNPVDDFFDDLERQRNER